MLRKNTSCDKCSLTCSSCDFYDPDHEIEVYQTVTFYGAGGLTASSMSPSIYSIGSLGSMLVKKKGVCRLHPNPIHKKPDDWCGQHSEYVK